MYHVAFTVWLTVALNVLVAPSSLLTGVAGAYDVMFGAPAGAAGACTSSLMPPAESVPAPDALYAHTVMFAHPLGPTVTFMNVSVVSLVHVPFMFTSYKSVMLPDPALHVWFTQKLPVVFARVVGSGGVVLVVGAIGTKTRNVVMFAPTRLFVVFRYRVPFQPSSSHAVPLYFQTARLDSSRPLMSESE